LDWRERTLPVGNPLETKNVKKFKRMLHNICDNRCFVVTQSGRVGLAPWNVKKGDIVAVLLGGKAPFVMPGCSGRAKPLRNDEETDRYSIIRSLARLTLMGKCITKERWQRILEREGSAAVVSSFVKL
jgi:hypothetical protein